MRSVSEQLASRAAEYSVARASWPRASWFRAQAPRLPARVFAAQACRAWMDLQLEAPGKLAPQAAAIPVAPPVLQPPARGSGTLSQSAGDWSVEERGRKQLPGPVEGRALERLARAWAVRASRLS